METEAEDACDLSVSPVKTGSTDFCVPSLLPFEYSPLGNHLELNIENDNIGSHEVEGAISC